MAATTARTAIDQETLYPTHRFSAIIDPAHANAETPIDMGMDVKRGAGHRGACL